MYNSALIIRRWENRIAIRSGSYHTLQIPFLKEYAISSQYRFPANPGYRVRDFAPFFHLSTISPSSFLQDSEIVLSNEKPVETASLSADCCSLDKALL
jgi:hypothetical protein